MAIGSYSELKIRLVSSSYTRTVALAESAPKRNGSGIQDVKITVKFISFMLLKFRQHTLIKLAGITSFFAVHFHVCRLDTLLAFVWYRQMCGISLSRSKSAGIKKAGTCTTTFAIFLHGWVLVRAYITYRSFLNRRLLESSSCGGLISLKFSEKKFTVALCVLIISVLKCR
jgi:hypothetical protein